jgi:hypothetical protein
MLQPFDLRDVIAAVVAAVSGSPLESMPIPASAKAEPPDAPLDVAYLPDESMDVKMFSTDCAVSDVQPLHVKLKTSLVMLDGFQLSNTSAEKSTRSLHPSHAWLIKRADGSSTENDVNPLFLHVRTKVKADDKLDVN